MNRLETFMAETGLSDAYFEYTYPTLIPRIRSGEFRDILNIGAGKGTESIYFALKYGVATVCYDEYEGHGAYLDDSSLLKERVSKYGLERLIRVRKGDVTTDSFDGESYDLLYTRNTMHHVFENSWSESDRDALFAKLHAIDHKHFCMYEVGRTNYKKFLRFILPRQLIYINTINGVEYHHKVDDDWWRSGIRNAGYSNCKVRYYVPRKLRALQGMISDKVLSRLGSSTYIIHADR